jgi:hypothetical protein
MTRLTQIGHHAFLKSSDAWTRLAAFKQYSAMNPSGRIILGALAAFILWSLVRAFRRGIIKSTSGCSFTLDDSPMLFTLTAIAHAGGALSFGYLAAGYEAAGITRWAGWQ